MKTNNVLPIIYTVTLFSPLIIYGIFMLAGRGPIVNIWYSSMSKDEKDKIDKKAFRKYLGILSLCLGILTPGAIISRIYDIVWLSYLFFCLVIAVLIILVLYVFKRNGFRK